MFPLISTSITQRTSSPLWKAIISLKDKIVAACDIQHQAIALMSTWGRGELSFTAQSYEFLRIRFLGLRWYENLGLCPDITSFYGWRLWASCELVTGFASCNSTLCVFSVWLMKSPTIIYFSVVHRPLFFGG
jgi:hypothetical protein